MSDEVITVEHVELPRYLGTWYEIARKPMWAEDRRHAMSPPPTNWKDKRPCPRAQHLPERRGGEVEQRRRGGCCWTPPTPTQRELHAEGAALGVPFTQGNYWIYGWSPATTSRWSARPTANTCGCSRAMHSRTNRPCVTGCTTRRKTASTSATSSARARAEPCIGSEPRIIDATTKRPRNPVAFRIIATAWSHRHRLVEGLWFAFLRELAHRDAGAEHVLVAVHVVHARHRRPVFLALSSVSSGNTASSRL